MKGKQTALRAMALAIALAALLLSARAQEAQPQPQRGSIGVSFRATASGNETVLRAFGVTHGVIIEGVVEGSPAQRAGLRQGDVIVEVDGVPIYKGDDLVSRVVATPIGRRLRIRYVRDKKTLATTVRVEDRAIVFRQTPEPTPELDPAEAVHSALGMTLRELSPEETQGSALLMVWEVKPESFAAELGLAPGDILTEINQKKIQTRDDLLAVERSLKPNAYVGVALVRPVGGREVPLSIVGRLPKDYSPLSAPTDAASAPKSPSPPEVVVLEPGADAEVTGEKVTVRGIAMDARAVTAVRVGGRVAAMQPRSERAMEFWLEDVALQPGENEIEIVAKNVDGAEAKTVVKVRRVEAAPKPAAPTGLTLEQVVKLLEGGVSPVRVEAIVKERGVNFALTDETEAKLKEAGASPELIIAIAKAKK